ncbi:MAG: hypothetical protein Q9181_007338 [Wetmoreana brouardii]
MAMVNGRRVLPDCTKCGREFDDFKQLHSHEEKYQRRCFDPECPKIIKTCVGEREVFRHMRSYHRNMVCMICERSFTSLRSKMEHDYEQHPTCSKCPWMVFADEEALYEHYETSWHHEYTYCCECETDFDTESHYRKHVCLRYDDEEFEYDDDITSGFSRLDLGADEMDRHDRARHPKVTFEEPLKAPKHAHHAHRDDRTRRCEPRDGHSYSDRRRRHAHDTRDSEPRDGHSHSGRRRRHAYDTHDSYDPRSVPDPSTKSRLKVLLAKPFSDTNHSRSRSSRSSRSQQSRTPRPSASKPQTEQPPKNRAATLEASLDLYELFRVDPSSSQAEIEKAVKKKRIACHPDRLKEAGMSSAELRFIDEQAKLIGGAAEVLLDPKKRKLYDGKGSKRSGTMAFNFNWSPLTADASFYTRVQELLTTAINKSPKPPIIVDDIIVNELNLGSVPPDLEILEIGDLAEDRFRGIFKMCYTGDAYLTLKTRVQASESPMVQCVRDILIQPQANPLNTYLSTKPSFTSPQPLAASSGLTIPLQITLSEIKLSAFIILVFSRQKGLTLVFRNDPLESLKVSSTFDAIPFVREYLQKEIEGQLRTLLMDEVPAIIHRLSLRLWVPEYRAKEDEELARQEQNPVSDEKPIDPLASPPQDPVDVSGNILDVSQIAALSLDSNSEHHSLFSQKNLLRLAALTDSHRTLSLFTPGIRDAVFRAWTGPSERGESSGISVTPIVPTISRAHSWAGTTSHTYTFSDSSDVPSSGRPTLSSFGSAATGFGLGANRHAKPHGGRRKKHRVVNLRKRAAEGEELHSVTDEGSTVSGTTSSAQSEFGASLPSQEREGEMVTPPQSPPRKPARRRDWDVSNETRPESSRHHTPRNTYAEHTSELTPKPSRDPYLNGRPASPTRRPKYQTSQSYQPLAYQAENAQPQPSSEAPQPPIVSPFQYLDLPTGGILEQAWMMKMAGEIARRVHEEKTASSSFWDRAGHVRDEVPPPAYRS